MWRSRTMRRPLCSNRARISPVSPRAKASGLTRMSVRSMGAPGSRSGRRGSLVQDRRATRNRLRPRPVVRTRALAAVGVGGALGGLASPAPATGRRRGHLGLAERADPPQRIQRLGAVGARVLELAHAVGAAQVLALGRVVAVRTELEVELVQPRLGGLHLQLALAHVV